MSRTPLIAVSLLGLAACNSGAGGTANQAAGANAADMTPEGPSVTAKLFGGGKPMPLDLQHQAANGMILYVTSIQAKPTETVVGIKVVNGADRDVELEWTDQKTFLVAGGQKFFVSPPLENKDLKITKGTTMQGELVFLGRLPENAAVTMVMNDGMTDSQYTNTPGLSIPLPVDQSAFSDDGSKKLSSLTFASDLARSRLGAAAATGSALAATNGTPTSQLGEVEKLQSQLGATETERGTMVSLPGDVTFDYDKATIRADARPTLDKLADLIKAQNPASVAIEGHTDSKGDDAYNQKLSERRATAVRDYLISVRTVDGTKVTTKGFGELKPVAPNALPDGGDNPAGREKNRRVEVILGKAR